MNQKQKKSRFERLYVQLAELLEKSPDSQSAMASISAVLFHKISDWSWVGFYRLVGDLLYIGPYQGPVACQVLPAGSGVCQLAVTELKSIIVPNVHAFPGHIPCDSRTNSELVVPVIKDGTVLSVIDLDSRQFNTFDEIDAEFIEKIAAFPILRD
ncbi:MAG TPA: GAF domain-containing protein [Candidatus Marinimicrobia bacterium]|nr:GAF domain-containing protein [Candidatus Neomarinimicrobiota bacterium]